MPTVWERLQAGFPTGATPQDVYGSGIEGLLAARRGPLADYMANARLASHRSALASLGMNERRTDYGGQPALTRRGYSRSRGGNELKGLYFPDEDMTVVDPAYPSVPVHEAIHAGLEKIRPGITSPLSEVLTRMAMSRFYPEAEYQEDFPTDPPPLNKALRQFYGMEEPEGFPEQTFAMMLDKMEKAAAKEIARRRPGGPR